jgi:hypothetical protein
MIEREHNRPITKQATALDISRGRVYYLAQLIAPTDLAIVRRMDELHLDFPFVGSRMLRDLLNAEGVVIGLRHVATLMKRMGIEALHRRPSTSKPGTEAQDLSLSVTQPAGHADQPGVDDGHYRDWVLDENFISCKIADETSKG